MKKVDMSDPLMVVPCRAEGTWQAHNTAFAVAGSPFSGEQRTGEDSIPCMK
jgi:hypothetical protein